MNKISKHQAVLEKFFQNKLHMSTLRTAKFPSTIKNNIKGKILKNQIKTSKDLDYSTFHENLIKQRESSEVVITSNKIQPSPFKNSFASNSEHSLKNMPTTITNIHPHHDSDHVDTNCYTIYSMYSDNRTPSFALESAFESSKEVIKTSNTGKNIFRTFGSQNTKKSNFLPEKSNEIMTQSKYSFVKSFINRRI
jgi:hypothetical protein